MYEIHGISGVKFMVLYVWSSWYFTFEIHIISWNSMDCINLFYAGDAGCSLAQHVDYGTHLYSAFGGVDILACGDL